MSSTKSLLVFGLLVSMTFASCSDFATTPQAAAIEQTAKSMPGEKDIVLRSITDPVERQILSNRFRNVNPKGSARLNSFSEIVLGSLSWYYPNNGNSAQNSWVGFGQTVDFKPLSGQDNKLTLEFVVDSLGTTINYAKSTSTIAWDPNQPNKTYYNALPSFQVWYKVGGAGTYTLKMYGSDNDDVNSFTTLSTQLLATRSVTVQ